MRVAQIGRWFLPWACVLVVSATIAHAANDALERTLLEEPVPARATPEPCRSACAHWIDISSMDRVGRPVTISCQAADGSLSADTLQVNFDDLHEVIVDVCGKLAG